MQAQRMGMTFLVFYAQNETWLRDAKNFNQNAEIQNC